MTLWNRRPEGEHSVRNSSTTRSLGGSRGIASILLALTLVLTLGVLTSCAPAATNGPSGSTSTTVPAVTPPATAPVVASAETEGALVAAKVLATAIADKDEATYATVWDNDAVVGALYEPFVAEVLKNSPGFARLARSSGGGDDVEGFLRKVMPKDKFVAVTAFTAREWVKERLDLAAAVATGDASEARIAAKTAAGLGIVLVMERQSGDWKVIGIEGPFRDLFVKKMVVGFESIMPK